MLDEWFTKQGYSSKDSEFDLIYVNGGNNLENLKAPDDTWKVRLIEEDFHRLMFETEGAVMAKCRSASAHDARTGRRCRSPTSWCSTSGCSRCSTSSASRNWPSTCATKRWKGWTRTTSITFTTRSRRSSST